MTYTRPFSRRGFLLEQPWVLAAGTAAAFLGATITASSDDGPVLCLFRRCTGGYCPGCGLTRSGGLLIRGNLVESWGLHPFLPLLLGQILLVGSGRLVSPTRIRPLLSRWVPTLVVINMIVLIGIWLARLTTGRIPIPFT